MKKEKTKDKEEVCEIFEVKKEGKEKVETSCGSMPKKHATKKEIKEYNKILRNIFIILGVIFLLIFGGKFVLESIRHIEYSEVDFKIVREHNLIFYNTVIPIYSKEGKHLADYNFYLRKDPRKLEAIEFDGELNLKKIAVINMTDDFKCDGDGVIGLANLIKLYDVIGSKIVRDENSTTCDSEGKYMFLNVLPAEETKIEKTGPACYELQVKDCEILNATERFMVETFIEVNSMLKQ